MKILIAPNSMKGSLNALDFADIIEKAFLDFSTEFETKKIPVADGGDYTGEILKKHFKADTVKLTVKGPLRKLVNANYATSESTAIIEMADASGMKLVRDKELNPMEANSFGTGELISDAIKKGCNKIYLAIGGSATVDGGMGMLEAMGFRFFDEEKQQLHGCGKNLIKIKEIRTSGIINPPEIKVICDVDNPLLGVNGAATVFGPQKGATPKMVKELEKGLTNWANVIKATTQIDITKTHGMGAAGGIAAPLVAFLNAEIVPGASFVLEQLNFQKHVKWADMIITGEGKIDEQTLNNKAPFAVLKEAKKWNKQVIAIGGKIETAGASAFDGAFSFLNGPLSLNEAMKNTRELLYNFSFELAKMIYKISNERK